VNYSYLLGLPASFAMGIMLGLTGGGGSILTLPIFVYIFHVSAQLSTSYSLLVVGMVASFGAFHAYRNKELDLRLALAFGIPGIFGVKFSRNILLPLLPEKIAIANYAWSKDSLLLIAFAILMLVVASNMLRAATLKQVLGKTQSVSDSKISPLCYVQGFLTGALAGFVGAGGGFILVPALMHFANLEMKKAVGTSLLIIALQSLLGISSDRAFFENADYRLLLSVLGVAIIGMQGGSTLRHRISPAKLKKAFGIFVFLMGIIIFVKEIRGIAT